METFRQMVNTCIKIGLESGESSPNTLCKLCYHRLKGYGMISYYKLCAISHAAGMLGNRKKSISRGLRLRQPYARRALLISCYGFKIADGKLKVPLGNKKYHDIPLNSYVNNVLSNSSLRIRSFTLNC
jgi:putative transposase